jgi:hypothetical protein
VRRSSIITLALAAVLDDPIVFVNDGLCAF